jgi:O-antigen/teichoic acid export membrane protein
MLNGLVLTLHRYGLASLAPVTVSVTQFLLQMELLRVLDATAFGLFAFIFGFIQFGFGLSNALVSTPYAACANGTDFSDRNAQAFFKVNLAFSAIWGGSSGVGAAALGCGDEAWLFGLFGFLAMIRWFGRAHLYAVHRPARAAISDFVYSTVLLLCVSVAWSWKPSLLSAMAMLCVASAAGALAIGRAFIEMQFGKAWSGSLFDYKTIWQDQARWTLLGVVMSEATSNTHSYAVSLFVGPAAFAPIAAATLLIKPISVVITSLTQLERPVMARHLTNGNLTAVLRSVAAFRMALFFTWTGTIAAGATLLLWFPRLLFRPSYDLGMVIIAFILWAGISLLQSWSTPASVLLQAARWFKPLACSGIASAVIAIIVVLTSVLLLPPVYTLVGILLGQFVMNWNITVLKNRWMNGGVDASPRRGISPTTTKSIA